MSRVVVHVDLAEFHFSGNRVTQACAGGLQPRNSWPSGQVLKKSEAVIVVPVKVDGK